MKMTNHPSRGRKAPVQIKRQDGSWGEATAWFNEVGKDGFGKDDETRASARAIVAAAFMGCAVKDQTDRARTVIEFSGSAYDAWIEGDSVSDPVLRAFINPRTGALRRDALEEAAKLYLATFE
jgi:hypothetical protein